ncbi:MAG: hypothetical protein ACREO9_07435, partial [Lysobacterales bacterium]
MKPDRSSRSDAAGNQPARNELRVYAERLLARREFAVAELEQRLLRKWAGADQIEARVAELIAELQAGG